MTEQTANLASTTLSAGISDSATTLTVADGSVFPSDGMFRLNCEDELMLCTARSGNSLTVERGIEGTSGAAHSSGETIRGVVTAAGIDLIVRDRLPYFAHTRQASGRWIWAHRGDIGSSDSYPENTLEACRQAILRGASVVEIDVRQSSDGTFHAMHDATVDRTTDGTGNISAKTDAQIAALDIDGGNGYDAGRHGTSLDVPTLAAVIDALEPYDAGYKLDLQLSTDASATALAEQVLAANIAHRTMIEVDTLTQAQAVKDVCAGIAVMANVSLSGADSDDNVDWLSADQTQVSSLAYVTGKAPKKVGGHISISEYGNDETTHQYNMWDRGVSSFQSQDLEKALQRQPSVPGYRPAAWEYDYTQITSSVTPGTSHTTVITGGSFVLDRATNLIVEFYVPACRPNTTSASDTIYFWLYDGLTELGGFGQYKPGHAADSNIPWFGRYRVAAAAGTRQYILKASVSAGTGWIGAGAGGSGSARGPAFLRVIKE